MKQVARHQCPHEDRTGMVLVLVLVVVMMLSFAVYSFSQLMVTEYAATTTGLQHLQMRQLADSGIEIAATRIRRTESRAGRTEFSAVAPIPVSLPDGREGRISLLRQIPFPGQGAEFGLIDESAKLNINALPLEASKRKEARRRLMALPRLTVQTADAILDWLDPDDEVSEFGAETSYYTSRTPRRVPRQGPFQSLNELLLVRGVTSELLFGEDQNQNGILDPEENDGSQSDPPDNRDGMLQRGWSDFLTICGCEATTLADGRQKICLNQPVLANLYDQLEPVFGPEAATYIVAWRMRGATYVDDPRPDEGEDRERRRLERLESLRQRLEAQLGQVNGTNRTLAAGETRRGGLTLTDGSMSFRSVVELFGGQVRIEIDGRDTLLQSPWPADPLTLRRLLPFFERAMTTVESAVLPGRININEAPLPVLLSIPGVTESTARAIVRLQPEIHKSQDDDEFSSVAWLAGRGLVSTGQLRAMSSYINTGGRIRSGVAIGQLTGAGSVAATWFLLDCSTWETHVMSMHDLPVMSAQACGL